MVNKSKSCPQCGKSYVLASSLKTHLLSHARVHSHKCSRCLISFSDKDLFDKHECGGYQAGFLTNLHDIKSFSSCFSNDENIDKQIKVYRKPFKCSECLKVFFERGALKDHMLLSHKNETISDMSAVQEDKSCLKVDGNSTSQNSYISKTIDPESNLINDKYLFPLCDNIPMDLISQENNLNLDENGIIGNLSHTTNDKDKGQTLNQAFPSFPLDLCDDFPVTLPLGMETKDHMEMLNDENSPISHKTIEDTIDNLQWNETNFGEEIKINLLKKGNQEMSCLLYENEPGSLIFSILSEDAQPDETVCGPCKSIDIWSSLEQSCHQYFSLSLNTLTSTNNSQSITIQKAYDCPVCSLYFLEEAEMKNHALVTHNLEPGNLEKLDCFRTEIFDEDDSIENSYLIKDIDKKLDDDRLMQNLDMRSVNFEEMSLFNHEDEQETSKCSVCNKEFENYRKLASHKRIHGVRKHICDVCGKGFRANSYLKAHMSVHSSLRPHECMICNKSFKNIPALQLHKIVHSNLRPFQCTVCQANFKHKNALTLHQTVHLNDRPFKCKMCEKMFKSNVFLKNHMKIHDKPITSESKLFDCSICFKSFSSKKYMKSHMRLHSSDVPYKCKYCSKGFTMQVYLAQHLRTHTGEKPFKCTVCEKSFAVRSTLRNHMNIHSAQKRYVCHICGIRVTQQQTLITHMKRHKSEKRHTCAFCDKRFILKTELERHMRVHDGKRQYECELCNKKFKQNAHLKKHMTCHKEGKPHRCSVYNKGFSYKSTLKNHMLNLSESQPTDSKNTMP